ncbi:MAG: ABC transporter permease [Gemmatimonadetes bacterium]|nr:ABC transporter permease [Gemmatimonadota bacterium]
MIVLGFLLQTVRIAVPFLFAAVGGVLSERSGLVALGLEGFMLGGAFGAVIGDFYGGGAWGGIAAGVVVGVALAALYALCVVRFRADQVIVGIAINLLVIGATRFFLLLAFDSASNSPRVAGFGEAGRGLLSSLGNPLLWLGILAVPLTAWLVHRTPFGLRLRAVGEHPEAAESLGIRVPRVRTLAVLLSGALAALGGVYLALEQHQFSDQMTAGRGFIALAAVIFGRWDPARAGVACLLFAAAETLEIQLQTVSVVPSQFVAMIPYVLTIVALAGVVGRAVPPAALGKTATVAD